MPKFLLTLGLLAGLFLAAGCNPDAPKPDQKKATGTTEQPEDDGHGWWCDEHGVKESECSMCSAKVAKAFQAKGDWCKEHNRAKSQCFICDPSLREKFAVDYRVKYGKEPPEPTDNMPPKK